MKASSTNFFIVSLALLLLSGIGCRRKPQVYTDFSGTLELTEHGLGVPMQGRLSSLKVDEGDEVKMGQLIATVEHYDQAVRDYERLYQLQAQGGANRQQVEQAELAVRDQRVNSPVDGVVLTKVHEVGEVVDARSPIVIIGDRSSLWVRIYIPEGLINRVQMNQAAIVSFDGLERSFKGHVSYISPQAEFTPRNVQTPEERVTQTFAVKITLDEKELYLRPGVAADVHFLWGPEEEKP